MQGKSLSFFLKSYILMVFIQGTDIVGNYRYSWLSSICKYYLQVWNTNEHLAQCLVGLTSLFIHAQTHALTHFRDSSHLLSLSLSHCHPANQNVTPTHPHPHTWTHTLTRTLQCIWHISWTSDPSSFAELLKIRPREMFGQECVRVCVCVYKCALERERKRERVWKEF